MDLTDHDNVNEATITHRVIALFAGYVVEVEYDATVKRSAALTAGRDFEQAKDVLRRLGLSEDLRPWLIKARQFVRKGRRAIEMIALELGVKRA
jgi:hypothetical protein